MARAGSSPVNAVPEFDGYLLRAWGMSDGMPSNHGSGLAQTPDGYLWLVTPQGLARFDGIAFTPATPSGVDSTTITRIFSAGDGALWVGTASGGIARGDGRRFETILAGGAESLPMELPAFSQDREGGVWFREADGARTFRWFGGAVSSTVSGDGRGRLTFPRGAPAMVQFLAEDRERGTDRPESRGDGCWLPDPAALTFAIRTAWWETAAFRATAAVTLLLILGWTVRWAVSRRLQARMRRLEQENAFERERARIARDMHDDIGASLTSLAFLSDAAARQQSLPPESARQIQEIAGKARSVAGTLDRIVWTVNPQNDLIRPTNLNPFPAVRRKSFVCSRRRANTRKSPWTFGSVLIRSDGTSAGFMRSCKCILAPRRS